MADAFEEFQARVRANARIHTEADLYWRTNRWVADGDGSGAVALKVGPITVIATGGGKSTFLQSVYRNDVLDTVKEIDRAKMESSYRSLYHSTKPCPPGQGRIYRR